MDNVFNEGVFPDCLKIGKISPIYKAGDPTQVQNYRPITVICTFSKILESLLKNRISTYINKYIGFDTFQYGFIKDSSTLCATTDFINYISTELDRKKQAVVVFIDLKKAFDVVDHSVLLNKLNRMGIRGNALSVIETYLRD